MAYPNHKNKTVVEYNCYGDFPHVYQLNGHPLIKCQENGLWSSPNFTCNSTVKKLERFNVQPPSNESLTSDDKSDNHATIIGTSLAVVIFLSLITLALICFAKKRQNSNANIFRQIENGETIEPVEIVSNHGRFMAS